MFNYQNKMLFILCFLIIVSFISFADPVEESIDDALRYLSSAAYWVNYIYDQVGSDQENIRIHIIIAQKKLIHARSIPSITNLKCELVGDAMLHVSMALQLAEVHRKPFNAGKLKTSGWITSLMILSRGISPPFFPGDPLVHFINKLELAYGEIRTAAEYMAPYCPNY